MAPQLAAAAPPRPRRRRARGEITFRVGAAAAGGGAIGGGAGGVERGARAERAACRAATRSARRTARGGRAPEQKPCAVYFVELVDTQTFSDTAARCAAGRSTPSCRPAPARELRAARRGSLAPGGGATGGATGGVGARRDLRRRGERDAVQRRPARAEIRRAALQLHDAVEKELKAPAARRRAPSGRRASTRSGRRAARRAAAAGRPPAAAAAERRPFCYPIEVLRGRARARRLRRRGRAPHGPRRAQARLLERARPSRSSSRRLQTSPTATYWRPQLRTKAQRADAEHSASRASCALRSARRPRSGSAGLRGRGRARRVWGRRRGRAAPGGKQPCRQTPPPPPAPARGPRPRARPRRRRADGQADDDDADDSDLDDGKSARRKPKAAGGARGARAGASRRAATARTRGCARSRSTRSRRSKRTATSAASRPRSRSCTR